MVTSVQTNGEIAQLVREVNRGTRVISIGGLTSSASKAYILAHVQNATGKTFVVVTDSNKDLETLDCDLEFWSKRINGDDATVPVDSAFRIPHSAILSLPSFDTDVYSGVSPHAETQERRAMTLWRLAKEKPDFLVTTARSLITRTITPTEIGSLGAVLRRDVDFPPDELIERLVSAGYVREDPLYNVGQFSVRGGIV
ncbi:MAG TPA: hypothetical protein VHL50_00725, partial [Pyrinomonadaceae bacterium]|nr:hypothetical protein [Pyrinomonadaceae bacterium]